MFINTFPKHPAYLTNIMLLALIRYMKLDSSHVTCFGKSIGLNDFLVKLHLTVSNLIMRGQ